MAGRIVRFVFVTLLLGGIYMAVAGRDIWRDRQDEQTRYEVLSPEKGAALAGGVVRLVEKRYESLDGDIEKSLARIAEYESSAQSLSAEPEGAIYAARKQEDIKDQKVLLSWYQHQKTALNYVRTEVSAGNIALEVTQLQNTHIVLLVKDRSKTIRDGQKRLPSFRYDEMIGRSIVEGLAPVVFDKEVNPDIPIHDIILVGLPNVVMPYTRKTVPVVAYKYRYPHYRWTGVVDWNEVPTADEVETLLRPTVWKF